MKPLDENSKGFFCIKKQKPGSTYIEVYIETKGVIVIEVGFQFSKWTIFSLLF